MNLVNEINQELEKKFTTAASRQTGDRGVTNLVI